jgi:hypothetical protein
MDAQVISGDGSDSWSIHVNFTILLTYYHHYLPSVNDTHVSLLGRTNVNSHYLVNETLPCLVSMCIAQPQCCHAHTSGCRWRSYFSIFVLSTIAIPICFGVIVGLVVLAAVVKQAVLTLYKWSRHRESDHIIEIASQKKLATVTHMSLKGVVKVGTAKVAPTTGK